MISTRGMAIMIRSWALYLGIIAIGGLCIGAGIAFADPPAPNSGPSAPTASTQDTSRGIPLPPPNARRLVLSPVRISPEDAASARDAINATERAERAPPAPSNDGLLSRLNCSREGNQERHDDGLGEVTTRTNGSVTCGNSDVGRALARRTAEDAARSDNQATLPRNPQ